ncbi:MAG: T9SS type A sorting domain-containing protein [Saprospiraceae bacterium]|nr:T9SS type A sorting domain-containing protein [Saprospiraceae bacterium]
MFPNQIGDFKHIINTELLKSGIYIVKIQNNTKTYSDKLIVIK